MQQKYRVFKKYVVLKPPLYLFEWLLNKILKFGIRVQRFFPVISATNNANNANLKGKPLEDTKDVSWISPCWVAHRFKALYFLID